MDASSPPVAELHRRTFPSPEALAALSFARWKLKTVQLPLNADTQLEVDRLEDLGWEPLGSGDGAFLHFRLRNPQPGAFVSDALVGSARGRLIRGLFPGWEQIRPLQGGQTLKESYPRIVMLWRPRSRKALLWLRQQLRTRVKGELKELEWLV